MSNTFRIQGGIKLKWLRAFGGRLIHPMAKTRITGQVSAVQTKQVPTQLAMPLYAKLLTRNLVPLIEVTYLQGLETFWLY